MFCSRKSEGRLGLNGVFAVDGLEDMLGAAGIERLDVISSFIGALLNRIYGEPESCLVTKLFTEYVDVMNNVCGNNGP